jgi:NAD+ kinase
MSHMKKALLLSKEPKKPRKLLEKKGFKVVKTKPDFILVVGGDGNVLRAERLYGKGNIPILPINAGRLGFLSRGTLEELEEILDKIKTDDHYIEERCKLDCFINNKKIGEALNEVLFINNYIGRAIRVTLLVNGEELGRYTCDSIIFSTPTGSTAYNYAVGGPIMEPGLGVILVYPVHPHTEKPSYFVFNSKKNLELKFLKQNTKISLLLDGFKFRTLTYRDTVKVKGSKSKTKFISPFKPTNKTRIKELKKLFT